MSRRRTDRRAAVVALALLSAYGGAEADAQPGPGGPTTAVLEGATRSGTRATVTLGGYVELFYQWNFNRPSNGITAYRGFDNRHNSLTVSNAVLDVAGAVGPVAARLTLQIGHTPESYYLSEPSSRAIGGAGASDASVWKYFQQLSVAYTVPIGRGLLIDAGIFLSPIGPEGMAVKDEWNWSRSNLAYGLPFYHTGIRATYPFTSRLSASLHLYNGWNSVVDNNAEKSLAFGVVYRLPDRLTVQGLYFTGVERSPGAPEGQPWRHLVDVSVAHTPHRRLSWMLHGNAGLEPNRMGLSWWAAAAGYARIEALRWLFVCARADLFYEHRARGAAGLASALFWPAAWVASQTLTADFRPADLVSVRLEYRHDGAAAPTYFSNASTIGLSGTLEPDARHQHTLTLGATAWF